MLASVTAASAPRQTDSSSAASPQVQLTSPLESSDRTIIEAANLVQIGSKPFDRQLTLLNKMSNPCIIIFCLESDNVVPACSALQLLGGDRTLISSQPRIFSIHPPEQGDTNMHNTYQQSIWVFIQAHELYFTQNIHLLHYPATKINDGQRNRKLSCGAFRRSVYTNTMQH